MNAERFHRVKSIFLEACERTDADRSSYLDQACGEDADLRTAVEQLLAHDQMPVRLLSPNRVRSQLERIVGIELEVDPSPAAMPREIGQYRILDMLGEGGMGMVYLAEQDKPRRTVALKVIAPGRAGRQTLRRFEHETQVLARLQHPGIAQIYEAGMFETGLGDQPYFAMELVRGRTLLEHARARDLDIPARLRLMIRVCLAVEHAHQKGVIHRDLKPGNIIVDETGGEEGQPKILDFGVARATDSDVHAVSMHTVSGQFVGTVAYMSPEQARGDARGLDLRSDIYSLGVLLYQLLTGEFPYVVDGPVHEALANIISAAPRRPRDLDPKIDQDVQTIILKALDKEPQRRYQSAGELARDIERFLRGMPIEARRDSTWYVLRKALGRHRVATGVAAGFAVVIGAALAVSILLWNAAAKARDEKNAEADKARAINDFLNGMLVSANPESDDGRGNGLTVRQVVDDAARDLESGRFADQPQVAAELHLTLGNTYRGLGAYDQARAQLEEAMRLRRGLHADDDPRIAEVLAAQADVEQAADQFKAAGDLAAQALAIVRRHPDCDPEIQTQVLDAAVTGAWNLGRQDEARRLMQETLAACGRLPREHQADDANWVANMAMLMHAPEEMALALKMLRASIAALEERHGRASWIVCAQYAKTASILAMQRDYAGAQEAQRCAVESAELVYGKRHRKYFDQLTQLALFHQFAGEYDRQQAVLDEGLSIAADMPDGQMIVAELMRDRSYGKRLMGDFAGNERDLRAALDAVTRAGGRHSRLGLSILVSLVSADIRQQDFDEAADICEEVRSVPLDEAPADSWTRAQATSLLGQILTGRGRYEEAERLLLEAHEALTRILPMPGRTEGSFQRIIALYQAWDAAAPDPEKARKRQQWQAAFDAFTARKQASSH